MAEFEDQFVGDIYRDPIVECGLHVLAQLDSALQGNPMADNVDGVTYIDTYPSVKSAYWRTTTTYTAEVMDGINADLLKEPQPPAYFYETLGGLVLAQIYHGNQQQSRHIPLFSPDRKEFDEHILSLWTMIPDSVRSMADSGEYTVPVHTLGNTTLELHKPANSAMWRLVFANRVSHARPVFDRDPEGVTIAKRFPEILIQRCGQVASAGANRLSRIARS